MKRKSLPAVMIYLCIIGVVGIIEADQQGNTILRQNYGVMFHTKGLIDNANSVWQQTFAIQLKNKPLPPINTYCNTDKQSPKNSNKFDINSLCPALQTYQQRHDSILEYIYTAQKNLDIILPPNKNLDNRNKRAIFDFVGHFAKSIFGVATTDDTRTLSSHILDIEQLSDATSTELHVLTDSFQSYIKTENKRDILCNQAIQLNHDAINYTHQLIEFTAEELYHNFVNWINFIHIYGIQYTDVLSDIRFHLEQEQIAIQTLFNGYLPQYFVSPLDLSTALDKITNHLKSFSVFELTHKDINHYYHIKDITYVLTMDTLYIKLNLPVADTKSTAFTVYQIHSIPIPIGPDHTDRTILEVEKPYLAVSLNKLFYMSLSQTEYESCVGDQLKRCSQARSMQETRKPNCALALLNDLPKLISELCPVTLLPSTNYSDSYILTISHNQYLVSSLDKVWIQSCASAAPMQIDSCNLCVIQPSCSCSIKAATFFIPASITHCHTSTVPLVTHSINLPALFHFYSDNSKLFNISAGMSFDTPVFHNIPNITITSKGPTI